MSSIAYLLAALMCLASWLAPNHYPPWGAFHGETLMAVALVVAGIAALWNDSRLRLPLTTLQAFTLVMALVPPLQWVLGPLSFAGDAWLVCAYLLGTALAQMIGWRLARQQGAGLVLERLSELFVAASLASVGLALYQWLSLRGLGIFAAELPPNARPFANLGQPNHLATLLFLGLVGTLFLHDQRRLRGGIAAACCVFLELGLVMTSSRTAWLAMTALVLGVWVARRRSALGLSRTAAAGMAASFVGLMWLWPRLCDALLLSTGRTFSEQSGAGPRVLLWQTALDAIGRKPWFGYGWEQTLVAHSQVVIDHPAGGRLMGNTHNLLLDLMVWNGIPLGVLIFVALLWWGVRRALTARDATAFYLLAAISGVFVHALVEYPLNYSYFLLPVALMAGALDQHTAARHRLRLAASWAWGLAIVATAMLVMTVIEYIQIEDNTRVLRFESARIGTGRIESVAPDLLMLTQWRDYLRFARIEPHPGMSSDELTWMRRVTERFPYAPSQFRSALAHGLNGRPDIAAKELRRLCAMHTARRCQEQLAAWRELTRTTYPQLAATAAPEAPVSTR